MNYTDLISAIKLMWQGMSAIFVVMGTILTIVYLFTSLVYKNKQKQ